MEEILLFDDLWDILSFENRHQLIKMLDSRVEYYENRLKIKGPNGESSKETNLKYFYENSLILIYKSLKKLDDYDKLVKDLSNQEIGIEELTEKELYTYYKRKYFALIAEKERK